MREFKTTKYYMNAGGELVIHYKGNMQSSEKLIFDKTETNKIRRVLTNSK